MEAIQVNTIQDHSLTISGEYTLDGFLHSTGGLNFDTTTTQAAELLMDLINL